MDKALHNTAQPKYFVKLSLLATLAISTQWLDAKVDSSNAQQRMMLRIAEIDIFGIKSRDFMAGAHTTKQEVEKCLSLLEEKITRSTNHKITPIFPNEKLSHDTHEIALAETERLVIIAAQHVNQTANFKATLDTMKNADALIHDFGEKQAAVLRQTIKKDIEKLEAALHIQTLEINSRLNTLIDAVNILPLAANSGLTEIAFIPTQKDDSIWPKQIYFLRENLQLKSILTRFPLLPRDTPNFRKNLKMAISWTNLNYDTKFRNCC